MTVTISGCAGDAAAERACDIASGTQDLQESARLILALEGEPQNDELAHAVKLAADSARLVVHYSAAPAPTAHPDAPTPTQANQDFAGLMDRLATRCAAS